MGFSATGASLLGAAAAKTGSGRGGGFFAGSAALPACAACLLPAGLNASNRSSTMVSAAYSSGAKPNSPRPCKHRLYSSWVSSGGRVCAKRAVSVASGSVSTSASSDLASMSGTACSTAMRWSTVVISSSVDAALRPFKRSASDVSTTVLPSPWASASSNLNT